MPTDFSENMNRYAEKHTEVESDVLQKINRETHLQVYQPNMMSGHLQGRFLSFISRIVQPKTIVEIGTFTGYSAFCLAEGLSEEGILHTIEIDDEMAERAQSYFKDSPWKEKIKLHIGDALDILPKIAAPIDLVFIDADKPNYSQYFDLLINKVRKGGILLADNVFYHGQVVQPIEKQGKNAQAISAFNKKVMQHKKIKPLFLPLRDGLFILEKI